MEADDDGGEPKRSAAFQLVLLRAGHYAEGGHPAHTGAELLLVILAETDSPAARLLGEKNMTRQDAVKLLSITSARGASM